MVLLTSFLAFLLVSALVFTVPGVYLLERAKVEFTKTEKITAGTVVGFVIFTLVSYLSTVVGLQIIAPIFSILFVVISLRGKSLKRAGFSLKKLNPKPKHFFVIAVFILGIAGQMAVIAPSGREVNGDLTFWSSHGFDGTWHISLMNEIERGSPQIGSSLWPFQNPIFAGEKLVNYHFFSDVAPAMFSKYLRFSNLDLYFRFFPFIFSLLLGLTAYTLVKRITKNSSMAAWGVFFTYFAGSFGYIVTYLKSRVIGGEILFWAPQIQSSSGNPPQAQANVLVLTYLLFMLVILKKKNKYLFFLSTLILGSLIMFKVYAFVVLIGATALVGLFNLIKSKQPQVLFLTAFSTFLGGLLYFPNVSNSTSFVIFQPWWFIRTMIVEPSRLDWIDHEWRRQTYIAEGNWKRVIYLEFQAFLIFFFGNLGMRALGIWDFVKTGKGIFKSSFNMLLIFTIIISLVLPLLFLQKGVAGNTSQFLEYFILLFGLLAGMSVGRLLNSTKPKALQIVFAGIIIILAVPTQLGLLVNFIQGLRLP